jgi:hypothetical protein
MKENNKTEVFSEDEILYIKKELYVEYEIEKIIKEIEKAKEEETIEFLKFKKQCKETMERCKEHIEIYSHEPSKYPKEVLYKGFIKCFLNKITSKIKEINGIDKKSDSITIEDYEEEIKLKNIRIKKLEIKKEEIKKKTTEISKEITKAAKRQSQTEAYRNIFILTIPITLILSIANYSSSFYFFLFIASIAITTFLEDSNRSSERYINSLYYTIEINAEEIRKINTQIEEI